MRGPHRSEDAHQHAFLVHLETNPPTWKHTVVREMGGLTDMPFQGPM